MKPLFLFNNGYVHIFIMVIQRSELHCRYNLFNKTSYEWRWQFSHYSNIKMKYQYYSKITFMFWADIGRFLQYFRYLYNSFINILAILQDFNGIFLKYSLNITVLCRYFIYIVSASLFKRNIHFIRNWNIIGLTCIRWNYFNQWSITSLDKIINLAASIPLMFVLILKIRE